MCLEPTQDRKHSRLIADRTGLGIPRCGLNFPIEASSQVEAYAAPKLAVDGSRRDVAAGFEAPDVMRFSECVHCIALHYASAQSSIGDRGLKKKGTDFTYLAK